MRRTITLSSTKYWSVGMISAFLLMFSCQADNEILSANDTQNVNSESAGAAYTAEGSSMVSSTVGSVTVSQYAGARAEATITITGAALKDDRLTCATITLTRTGTLLNPSGSISILFNGACTDPHGVIRSGSITINYMGRRWVPGSYWVIKQDYYRNSVHIQGQDSVVTQVSTDSLHLQFQSILTGGKVTFGDGKSITREHNLTREWVRSTIAGNDKWLTLANNGTSANGTASGTTKNGTSFAMQITKELVESVACRAEKVFIPVSGIKLITVGNNNYTIDYGSGACDNQVLVTINGKQKLITVNGDGN